MKLQEVISKDEIAMAITYQEAKEHDTLKEGRATKRRRKDGAHGTARKKTLHVAHTRLQVPRLSILPLTAEKEKRIWQKDNTRTFRRKISRQGGVFPIQVLHLCFLARTTAPVLSSVGAMVDPKRSLRGHR